MSTNEQEPEEPASSDDPAGQSLPPEDSGADVDTGASTVRFDGDLPKAAELIDAPAVDPDDTATETIMDEPPVVDETVDDNTELDGTPHPNPAHASLQFSQKALDRIEWLRTRYPAEHQRALVLPLLSMAQREFGWVSQEVVHYVAAQIPVPPMQVEEVATFYTMYNKAPIGRWHLQVCQNISCAIMGAEIVIEHISNKLGVQPGETTPDGQFTLIGAECLGSCGTAPMMQCNDHYYENLSLKDVDDLLERLSNEPDADVAAEPLYAGPGSGPSRMLPRDGAPLKAGLGIVVPHPGAHDDHGHDPKAREPVQQRPLAQDPDDKSGYEPRGMASR